jgi:lipid-binding SYLF domain-containing protein
MVKRRTLPLILAVAVMLAMPLFGGPAFAAEDEIGDGQDQFEAGKVHNLVASARRSFATMLGEARFSQVLARADALLIFPDISQTDFLVTGEKPTGVMLKRLADGGWGNPAFFRLGDDLDFGITDVALVVTNERSADSLAQGGAVLGEDVTVALGETAPEEGGEPDVDVLTFTFRHGLLSEIPHEGLAIVTDGDRNKSFYGTDVAAAEVLQDGDVSDPHAGDLVKAVQEAIAEDN